MIPRLAWRRAKPGAWGACGAPAGGLPLGGSRPELVAAKLAGKLAAGKHKHGPAGGKQIETAAGWLLGWWAQDTVGAQCNGLPWHTASATMLHCANAALLHYWRALLHCSAVQYTAHSAHCTVHQSSAVQRALCASAHCLLQTNTHTLELA